MVMYGNNNFNNQFGNGFGQNPQYGFNGGVVPNQQQLSPNMQSWLTPDKLALLRKGVAKFNLSVSDEELARGQCNHMSNGKSALIPDADGSGGYTCSICGTHMNVRELTNEEVKNATDNILDILNMVKITYLSLDPSTALEYFQIIPLIEKIPKLFEIAMNDFKRYDNSTSFVQGGNQNPFTLFNSIIGPGFGGGFMNAQPQGYYGNPQFNAAPQQYGAPAQYNPAMNPMYGQYQPQQMGYQQQPMGYQPQAVNAYQPQQPMGYQPQAANAQQPVAQEAAPAQTQQPQEAAPVKAEK